jgi:hypothetical protein
MTFDIKAYIDDFNAACGRNESEMIDRYFTEDLVMEGPDRTTRGREPWLQTLLHAHDGVTERLELLRVVREGSRIMAELDGYFLAHKDRPDFAIHPLMAGQELRTRFLASYDIRGDQISRLLLTWWPARPVTPSAS